jgi:3',5'-cyclic AMP phosphodiesterase CpdA
MKNCVTFGVISDVQYSDLETHNPEKRPATLGIRKLTEAVSELNKLPLDFVLNLGDLIDRDARCFAPILAVVNTLKVPVWHALGNHDFCGPQYDYGHKEEALTALGLTDDKRYYFRDFGLWRFIILDTNEVGTIEYSPGTIEWKIGQQYIEKNKAEGKINCLPWDGGIGKLQLEWLVRTIDDAASHGLKVIVCGHHGIYPEHSDNLLNDQELLKLLTNKPIVKAYINGHNHDGNYGLHKGLPCWNIEGMLDFTDKTAYAYVELFDSKMVIHGYGRTNSRIIALR